MRWLTVVAMLGGCSGDKSSDSTGDTSTETTPEAATFAEVRDQLLVPTCAVSSCHASGDVNGFTLPPGGEYDAIVNVASTEAPGETLVIPGDADGSYVVKKLENAPGIVPGPMPPPFGEQDPVLVDLVRSWIDAGALP